MGGKDTSCSLPQFCQVQPPKNLRAMLVAGDLLPQLSSATIGMATSRLRALGMGRVVRSLDFQLGTSRAFALFGQLALYFCTAFVLVLNDLPTDHSLLRELGATGLFPLLLRLKMPDVTW
jgi:hypothetical protein